MSIDKYLAISDEMHSATTLDTFSETMLDNSDTTVDEISSIVAM